MELGRGCVLGKVLLVSTCKYRLHEDEFLRPIADIVEKLDLDFDIVKYDEIGKFSSCEGNFRNYKKIIICGTALKDFDFLNYILDFNWLKIIDSSIAVLGICSGAQIIGKVFGSVVKDGFEVGSKQVEVVLKDEILKGVDFSESFVLHNKFVLVPEGFDLLAKNTDFPLIFKKMGTQIYGVLLHPEVRNKKLIENFLGLV